MKTPNMTSAHFEFIAEKVGPLVGWPSALHSIADELQQTNPRFNRERFISKASESWERHHLQLLGEQAEGIIDDEIQF